MTKIFYGYQWSEFDESGLVNFGDLITELIIRRLGYEYRPLHLAPLDAPITFMVGTILDASRLALCAGRKLVVWGSGYAWDRLELVAAGIDFRAVRGPDTRDILGLPSALPLGDPALLLPLLFPGVSSHGEVIAVPHWSQEIDTSFKTKCQNPRCGRENVVNVIREIAGAGFVLAGSLHAAIIAQAYGIPWAPWGSGVKLSDMSKAKWKDWLSYLGIEGAPFCDDVKQGEYWWHSRGQYGTLRDTQALLDAFPHDSAV